ncbi:unnamed protein product [Rhizophagus irregularis]|nr:unnamed protein product [Rhizophagus irregularis]CAB5360391.1 unnamed protein product [Rhizophagus irregularis]
MREKIPIGPRTSKEQSLSYFVKIINFKMEFFIFTNCILSIESNICKKNVIQGRCSKPSLLFSASKDLSIRL